MRFLDDHPDRTPGTPPRARRETLFIAAALVASTCSTGLARAIPESARVRSSNSAVSIDFELPPFDLRPAVDALRAPYVPHVLDVPGLRNSVSAGLPALPSRSMLLALPPESTARLVIDDLSYHEIEAVWIAPPPTSPVDDGSGETRFESILDPEVYATDAFVPAAPIALSTRGVARDVDFVKVDLYPFQWNPVRGTLRVYDRLAFHVEHDDVSELPRDEPRPGSRPRGGGSSTVERGRSRAGVGIVRDSIAGDSAVEPMFANSPIPSSWRVRRPMSGRVEQMRNPAATTEAYKLEVAEDGLYRVTFADLQSAGLAGPVAFADLKLELRGTQVGMVAIDVGGDGTFGGGDSIRFVGHANPDRFTATHIYWLTVAGGGTMMSTADAFPAGNLSWPTVTTSRRVVRLEPNETQLNVTPMHPSVWEPWLRKTALQSFTGAPCFGPPNADTADLQLDAPNAAAPYPGRTYELRGRFVSWPPAGCIPPQQEIAVDLNGQPMGTVNWTIDANTIIADASYAIDASAVIDGANIVHLAQPALAGKLRRTYVDWIEFDYEAHLIADDDRLEVVGEWPNGARLALRGFTTGDVEAIDVRSDGQVKRLTGLQAITVGPGMPVTIFFTLPPTTVTHRVIVYGRPALRAPIVYRDTPSDLRNSAHQGEHLTIAHGSLIAAATPLTQFRSGQGMSAMLVDVQDVYDEFSWGNIDSLGIRDFLTLTLASGDGWSVPPSYVTLVGDTTLDFKDYRAHGVALMIPHGEHITLDPAADVRLISSDAFYQNIVGEDAVADLLIGRIPGRNPTEVTRYIDKLIRYESRPAGDTWNGRTMYVVDDNVLGSNNDCSVAQDSLELFTENIACCYLNGDTVGEHQVIFEDLYGWPQGHDVIIDERNLGVSMWIYFGHGSITKLGKKCETNLLDIFGSADVSLITNADAMPLFASISCNVGMMEWVEPTNGYSQSMSEVFTVGTANGDLAFISSSTKVSASEGLGQFEGMMDGLFEPGSSYLPPASWGLSSVTRRAGAIHYASQIGQLLNPRLQPAAAEDNARSLLLMGDPAALLKITQPPPSDNTTCPIPTWCPN